MPAWTEHGKAAGHHSKAAVNHSNAAGKAAGAAPQAGEPDGLRPLARAAAAGDGDAAATLIAHVGGSMLTVIRKMLGERSADVDDVAQDAVMALLGALGTFRGECSVVHFARRVALLTALAARRKTHVRQRWSDPTGAPVEELAGDEQDGGPGGAAGSELASPLATALASRRRTLVRQLLDELPDVLAESLALHFILGYTVEEIAEMAAVSPNTVWSRLRLGKRALRRRLDVDRNLAEMLEVGR